MPISRTILGPTEVGNLEGLMTCAPSDLSLYHLIVSMLDEIVAEAIFGKSADYMMEVLVS